jgi:competence protein ComEC
MNEFSFVSKPWFWLFLMLGLIGLAFSQLPDNQVHLVFCNVGQGDAALISYKQTQVLIDGGPNNSVLDCLGKHMPFWDRDIEMVVLTHPEEDHLGGLVDVFARYKVKYFLVNGIGKDTPVFWTLQQEVASSGVTIGSPNKGEEVKLGPMSFEVVWPEDKLGNELVWQKTIASDKQKVLGDSAITGELNDTAVVLLLKYGNFKALFSGDISTKTEEALSLRKINVLKVAHHGSKTSTGEQLLLMTKPDLAVISVGKNSFGHPTKETLDRLMAAGANIKRTDQNGDVEVVSDGENWWLSN